MKIVWVEITPRLDVTIRQRVLRIFKSQKAAFASNGVVLTMDRAIAVSNIRHQIFVRSKGFCEECGAVITEQSMEMHEKQWRGKGGEISVMNSEAVCRGTHKYEHRKRAPQFSRRKFDE